MSLSATFAADFSSFQAACLNAEASLKSFESGGARVEKQLNRVSDSLSGVKVVQQASLAAEAVDRLGGVAKLTDAELQRVGATAIEAAQKLTRLGQDVPPGIQKIADASKAAQGEVKELGEAAKLAKEVIGALGIAMSVGAVLEFTREVIASGHEIEVMAARMDVSVESAQRMKYAAEQTGTSIDVITRSIGIMGRSLVEDGPQVENALQAIGLSASEIRRMAPDEAFNAIAEAIRKVPDPMLQSEAAMRIFGRAALELLPAIRAGITEVEQSAVVMSKSSIEGLTKLEREYLRLKAVLKVDVGDAIAATTGSTEGYIMTAARLADALTGANLEKYAADFTDLANASERTAPLNSKAAKSIEEIARAGAAAAPSVEYLDTLLRNLEKSASEGAKAAAEAIAGDAKAALEEWQEIVKRHQEEQKAGERDVTDFLSKMDQEQLDDAKAALDEWREMVRRHTEEQKAGADEVTAYLAEQERQQLDDAHAQTEEWREVVRKHVQDEKDANAQIDKDLKDHAAAVDGALRDLTQSLSFLSQISGGSFGGIVKDIGTMISAIQAAESALKAVSDIVKTFQAPGGQGLSPKIQGYAQTAIVGAATGAEIVQLTGARNRAVGAAEGAAGGAALGALYGAHPAAAGPTLGASIAIGAVIGGIYGYFQAKHAADQVRDANNAASASIADMQKQLVAQYGSLGDIDRLGKQVGVDLIAAWGDQSIAGLQHFQAATTEFQDRVKALQSAVQEMGLTWRDLDRDHQLAATAAEANTLTQKLDVLKTAGYDMGKITSASAKELLSVLSDLADAGGIVPATLEDPIARLGQMQSITDDNATALNNYVAHTIAAGEQIPAALEPVVEKLITMGKLTDDNARAILGLSASAGPSLADVTSAADRYGLKLDQLGGKVMQLQITDEAKQVVADWKTMSAAGADMGAVMAGMQPKVESIVLDALKFGSELPESMKPMLQSMADAGELTDATGTKLTDLTKLTFAADLHDDIKDLIDSLKDFVSTIKSDVQPALADIGKTVIPPVHIPWVLDGAPSSDVSVALPTGGLITPAMVKHYAGGTGPVSPWIPQGTDTVPAMLTPGERVLSPAETRLYDARLGGSYRPASRSPILLTAKLYIDGREAAQTLVPAFAEELERLRLD